MHIESKLNAGDSANDTYQTLYVQQGEWASSSAPNTVITTTLGSCVSACLWDSTIGVGGLNHIVLPPNVNAPFQAMFSSVNAMELLINSLLKQGANKSNIRAKVFGGASILTLTSNVGQRNTEFVTDFLGREGIPVVGGNTGGSLAREIRFWPASGRAMQRFRHGEITAPVEQKEPMQSTGDIELF